MSRGSVHVPIALVLLMAAGCASPAPPLPADEPGEWISIAMVSGSDFPSQRRAERLLESAGIPSGMDGSVFYGISVPSAMAARARECLVACEPGEDTGWLVAPEVAIRGRRTTGFGLPLADALSREGIDSDVRGALHHPETADRSREYPILLRTEEWDQHWLSAGGQESAWHHVEVTLAADSGGEARRIVLGFFAREGRLSFWSLGFEPQAK